MNDQDVMRNRELLSALADGELHEHEFAQLAGYAAGGDGQACWQAYHVIGEALRRGDQLQPGTGDALLVRLRAQMAREGAPPRLAPGALQQVAPPRPAQAGGGTTRDPAANAEVLRWKLAAGFASLAAVAVLGWNTYAGLDAAPSQAGQLAALATQQPAAAPGQALVAATATGGPATAGGAPPQPPVMLRDPRLDELLAAHRQLGNNTTALQMPAGFLRNANFAGRER